MSRPHAMAEAPLIVARWLLLASIVLSVWLFGSTRPWTVQFMTWWLLVMGALFVMGLAARMRLPRVRWFIVLPSLFLLAQGWFMVWNASRQFVPFAEVFVDVTPRLPGWPGAVDAGLTFPWMLRTTGLIAALWVACDLSANRIWRDRLWVTLGATGASAMVLGLAQRFTGATSIFWDTYRYTGEWFFSVYRYHANAGSYINLALPIITGLAIRAFMRSDAERGRVFWVLAALATAACGFVNVSRAANVITALLLVAMAVWVASLRLRASSSRRLLQSVLLGTAIAATVGYLAVSFDLRGAQARWEKTKLDALLNDGRPEVYEIMIQGTLQEAGLWGYGQGTFEFVFNNARAALRHPLAGRWDYAHSDALQTIQDWGYAGSGAWIFLLVATLLAAVARSIRSGSGLDETKILSAAGAFALAGVMLHACVDFPLQILSLQLNTLVIAGLVAGLPRHAGDQIRRRRAVGLPGSSATPGTAAGSASQSHEPEGGRGDDE